MPAKKLLTYLFFVFAFLAGLVGSYLFLSVSKVFVRPTTTPTPTNSPTPSITSAPTTSFNFLLLGYGGVGHGGGSLSDVLILVNVDSIAKRATFVSIPRDLWVEIPVSSDRKEKHKINNAFAIGSDDKKFPLKEPQYKGEAGGGSLAKQVVGQIAGMPVHYFVAVDFSGFQKIIDSLGGIDVNVPVTFDDRYYPVKGLENETCGKSPEEIAELTKNYRDFELEKQFECRFEHLHFDAGSNKMDGVTALKYVRSRHSDTHGGDFSRSQRQHSVIVATKNKLISLSSVKTTDQVFNQFVNMVRTDLDLPHLNEVLKVLGEPNDYNIKFSSITTDNVLEDTYSSDGQYILIPKKGEGEWSEVQQFINKEIAESESS